MNCEHDNYDRIGVGDRIQKRRKELKMTQEYLAVKIDKATKYISEIERGKSGMSIELAIALSNELDISLDYILKGSDADFQMIKRMLLYYNDGKLIDTINKSNPNTFNSALDIVSVFYNSLNNN